MVATAQPAVQQQQNSFAARTAKRLLDAIGKHKAAEQREQIDKQFAQNNAADLWALLSSTIRQCVAEINEKMSNRILLWEPDRNDNIRLKLVLAKEKIMNIQFIDTQLQLTYKIEGVGANNVLRVAVELKENERTAVWASDGEPAENMTVEKTAEQLIEYFVDNAFK